MRFFYAAIFMFFVALPLGFAQQHIKRDSLQTALKNAPNDTSKVLIIKEIAETYLKENPEQALAYTLQMEELSKKNKYARGMALSTLFRGYHHNNKGDYTKALSLYLKALKGFEQINNWEQVGHTYNDIGILYFHLNNTDTTLVYFHRALGAFEKANDLKGISFILNNLGQFYMFDNQLEKAEEYYLRSLKVKEELNLPKNRLIQSWWGLANLQRRAKNYEKALFYFQKAESIAKKNQNYASLIATHNDMAKTYEAMGNFKQAEELILGSLQRAEKFNAKREIYSTSEQLMDFYAAQKEFKKAYSYFDKYKNYKDSIFNDDNAAKMAELLEAHQAEKKAAQIELLTKENHIKDLLNYGLVAGLITGVFVLLMLVYHITKRQRAYRQLSEQRNQLSLQNNQINLQKEELSAMLNKLQSTQQQLIQAEKMASLGQLTAGITHEINNPINFVTGGIEALKANFEDVNEVLALYQTLQKDSKLETFLENISELKEEIEFEEIMGDIPSLIDNIKQGAKRTSKIIKGLRIFAHVEDAILNKVNLNSEVSTALGLFKNDYGNRIDVTKTLDPNLPLMDSYGGLLHLIFHHLLTNAVQAMPDKGALFVRTQLTDNEQFVTLFIQDTGHGMSPQTQAKVFEPFFTTRQVGEGMGLGLAIVHSIVEKHQGKISVRSTESEGTTFEILLPILQNQI